MRKVISMLLSIAMMISSVVSVMAKEEESPFEGKENVNIVYLGGSITYGAGVPYEQRETSTWRAKISRYFDEKYPNINFNHINAGLSGTGSDMGIMRLERDVLSKNPDYVFIEFAVNDIGKPNAQRHMESIVRSLEQLDNVPYISFVYTAQYISGELKNVANVHDTVAEYYGIPTLNMKGDMEDAILSTGTMDDTDNVKRWLTDLVHPTADGYNVYYNAIRDALESGNFYKKPLHREKKLDVDSYPLSTKWIDAKTVKSTGAWTENNNASYGSGWTSSTAGDTLEFSFSGPVLGIQHRIGKECGQYTLNIDGKDVGTIDTYYSKTTSQGVLGYQNFALGAGEHRVKITVLGTKNEAIADGTETPVAFDWFVCEKNPSAYRWVNEDFEDCDFSRLIPTGKMTHEWSDTETAGDSKGAMKVTVTGNASGPSYRCETVNGTTYNVSAWIKVANIADWNISENSDKVRFVFQPKVLNADGSWSGSECYTECVVTDAGITSGDWVKVSTQYVCDGKGKVAGQNDRVAASDISRVEIRLGSGNLAATTGSADVPEIYYIDNLRIEPVSVDPQEEEADSNIIASGDFGSADSLDSWVKDGKATISFAAEEGANGTNGAALVTGTDAGQNSVGISQKALPIRANRAYKVSYWVKAANDAAVGAFPQMIIEYKGKQTDPSAGSTNYYPNYDMGTTYTQRIGMTTDAWQKVEYVYKKDGVTNDICIYPNMQIRLYSSEEGGGIFNADQPAFYIDEIRMDELETVYDGDFSTDPTSQVTSATAKYKYPWGKYNNSQTGIVWNENGYLTVTQKNVDELMTYLDLEEGETYRITLDAKLDEWTSQETSTITDEDLYMTAIYNRSRGDLSGETFTSQYIYFPSLPGAAAGPVERWTLTDDWQTYEAEFTIPQQESGAKPRSGYISFRLGNGKEEATYSIDNVSIEKVSSGTSPVPALSAPAFSGTAQVGEELTFSADYSCSSQCEAYIYTVYTGDDVNGYVQKTSAVTEADEFTYIPDAADAGKKIKVEIRAIAANGNYSNIVSVETEAVQSAEEDLETSAEAEFNTDEWGTRLDGSCDLTAGPEGATFKCILAVYNDEGKLIDLSIADRTLSKNTRETVPMVTAVSNKAYSAKLMVWDSNCIPYCQADELIDN